MTGRRAAILLAAGESRRMGQPKALLESREAGVTVLERLIDIHSRYGNPVVVVVGYHAAAVRAGTRRAVQWVENPAPERGQLSSLQCGLAALEAGASAMFQPVDYAGVSEDTVGRLAGTAGELVIPRYKDERGHPVGIGPEVIAALRALPPEGQAREVLRARYGHAVFVDVDDRWVVEDLDTPEEYARWRSAAE